MNTILVTSGNIGNFVVEGLRAKGLPVRVLVRRVSPNPRWQELGVEQVAGDFGDPESLADAFRGVEKFFSVTPFVENLAQLGMNAVEAARRAGVGYVVRSSALGASEDAPIWMGRAHGQVEAALQRSGMPYSILRPNTFMQSYLMHAASIQSQNAFYLPQGDGKVSLVDVRDIAELAVAALTEPGREGAVYEITGPEALSNSEIAGKLSTALGRTIQYVDVSEQQAQESLRASGVSPLLVNALIELFRISKAGYAAAVSPAVEQVLRRPARTFDGFLRDYRQEFSGALAAGGGDH